MPGARELALRAYVEAISALGDHYHDQYVDGNRGAIGALNAEELNLLHARTLSRQLGWWHLVIGTMQGLKVLYSHTGRKAEWARLVKEIVPNFVDPVTDGPLAGHEDGWSPVAQYRVRLAREARQWDEAERLQRICIDQVRLHACEADRNSIRTVAASLHELGEIQREIGRPESVDAYRESFEIALRIEDRPAAAVAAFNLGHSYKNLPALSNLDEAERWYGTSLDLRSKGDRMYRAASLAQLGAVAYARFQEARVAKKSTAELLRHLNDAFRRYHDALEMSPPDTVDQLAAIHGSLGDIYRDAGDIDRALGHYREAIRLDEAQCNLHRAAVARWTIALTLADAGRFADARR